MGASEVNTDVSLAVHKIRDCMKVSDFVKSHDSVVPVPLKLIQGALQYRTAVITKPGRHDSIGRASQQQSDGDDWTYTRWKCRNSS